MCIFNTIGWMPSIISLPSQMAIWMEWGSAGCQEPRAFALPFLYSSALLMKCCNVHLKNLHCYINLFELKLRTALYNLTVLFTRFENQGIILKQFQCFGNIFKLVFDVIFLVFKLFLGLFAFLDFALHILFNKTLFLLVFCLLFLYLLNILLIVPNATQMRH